MRIEPDDYDIMKRTQRLLRPSAQLFLSFDEKWEEIRIQLLCRVHGWINRENAYFLLKERYIYLPELLVDSITELFSSKYNLN